MRRARTWLSLCVVVASVGSLGTACGSDEATGGGKGGSAGAAGGSAIGGSGATSGAGATNGGSAGSSGSGGGTTTGALGKACTTDANCGSTGLECFIDPGVPQGLCTAACTVSADCSRFNANAVCDEANGICLEGCGIGSLNKCHTREDFSCQLQDAVDTESICTTDANCKTGELCNAGTCLKLILACLPTCGSDVDCSGNDVCNIGSGLCEEGPLGGKELGSACVAGELADEAECQGFCIGDAEGSFSLCSGNCTLGASTGCGWNGQPGTKADGACLFVPSYFGDLAAVGDVGYCGQLCDCTSDCRNPSFECVDFGADGAALATFYGRKGYCTSAEPADVVINDCSGAGGAGSGGEGGGSSGQGGTAGSSAGAGGDAGSGGSGASE